MEAGQFVVFDQVAAVPADGGQCLVVVGEHPGEAVRGEGAAVVDVVEPNFHGSHMVNEEPHPQVALTRGFEHLNPRWFRSLRKSMSTTPTLKGRGLAFQIYALFSRVVADTDRLVDNSPLFLIFFAPLQSA